MLPSRGPPQFCRHKQTGVVRHVLHRSQAAVADIHPLPDPHCRQHQGTQPEQLVGHPQLGFVQTGPSGLRVRNTSLIRQRSRYSLPAEQGSEAWPGDRPVSQTRAMSALEVLANTSVAFVISLAGSFVFNPLVGIQATPRQNVGVTVLFTILSLMRGYAIRRFFARMSRDHRIWNKLAAVDGSYWIRPTARRLVSIMVDANTKAEIYSAASLASLLISAS
jgi:hypothetical protein